MTITTKKDEKEKEKQEKKDVSEALGKGDEPSVAEDSDSDNEDAVLTEYEAITEALVKLFPDIQERSTAWKRRET